MMLVSALFVSLLFPLTSAQDDGDVPDLKSVTDCDEQGVADFQAGISFLCRFEKVNRVNRSVCDFLKIIFDFELKKRMT